MKTSVKFLFGAILAMGASAVFAQTQVPEELQNVECDNGMTAVANSSLYTEYAKQSNYRDAYEPWKALYHKVPNFHRDVYITGEKILKDRLNKLKKPEDAAARAMVVDSLIALYDNRMKYFDVEGKPMFTILGKKATDILALKKNNFDENVVFGWLESVVNALKDDADAKVLSNYVSISCSKYKKDPSFKANYIENYMKGTEYLDGALDRYQKRLEDDYAIVAGEKEGNMKKAVKDTTLAKQFIDYSRKAKIGLVQQFANSGAADVATLVEIFTPQVEEKKDDQVFLTNVSKLLGRSKEGRETDLYTTCADYSYQISPSMEAAKGLAQAALKKKEWERAMEYYEEALGHAIQIDDKTEILKYQAAIQIQNGKKPAARETLRKSLALDPNQSEPHVMIANLYATSVKESGLDSNIQGLVYVAAVNEMQQAVAHEEDPAKKANYQSTIAKYKAGYPDKQTIFMKQLKTGDAVSLGGWMGISITVP